MTTIHIEKPANLIEHHNEPTSNHLRHDLVETEPLSLRTRTPSMAVVHRSAGSYHYTPEGRKLADFTSGVLVSNLGHNPKRWWKRVMKYMALENAAGESGYHMGVTLTSYNAVTSVEMEANRRLLASLQREPGGARLEQILWAASGSEAVQKGLWAALAKRPKGDGIILATRSGFHGKKGLAGAVTGSELDRERDPRVRFISFPKEECSSLDRRREPIDLQPYRDELDRHKKEFGDRLCCLITEPYLGGGGSYHPQREYLQMLAQFCQENNILFFLDEIQSNFGRTGSMYAYTEYGVEPDLVALGKGMGNGIPVDAVVGRADVFARMTFGEGSDTWSAHPLGCAAVLATLDEFEQSDVLVQGKKLAIAIEECLIKLTELPAIDLVRGEGTVWGIECQAVGDRSAEEVANEIVRLCYLGDAQGRAIHLLGPLAGKVIRIAPPLTMAVEELHEYFQVMHQLVASIS